jgi:hypothetical protein
MYSLIPLGELHTMYSGDKQVNPWWNLDYALNMGWFVWFLSMVLSFVIIGVVFVRLSRMQDISVRVASWTMLLYWVANFFKFFNDLCSSKGYLFLYASFFLFSEVIEHLILIKRR